MELLVGTLPNMLSISKGQKDRDARRFAVEPSKQTCSKPSMDCDAVEKLSLDDKFPLFTKSLEGASVPVQPPTRGQSQLTVQSAYTAGSHPTKAAIVTATKEAKAALTSSRKPKWTPEQKRQRREQRALQGENKTPRGRSNGQRQVASERDSRIDGGVSIIPEFEAKGAAKPKPITTTLPVRSARKASLDKKIYSASENTLEAKMTSIKAAHHLSTSITNLNPNAPTYKPTKLAPAGGLYNPQYQNSQPFVPYQPMRSVPVSYKLPPWRIDKIHRFASAVATQNSFPSPPNGSSSAKGRPTALTSQADRQAKFNIPKGIATANPLLSALHKDPKLHRNAPQPTVAYIEQSSLPPRPSAKPGNLLLVLDINGTLLYRRKRTTHIYPRPSLKEFLNYCLKTHSVLVWSSAQPVNVDMICSRIFSPAERSQLVAEWGRNTLELSAADYRQNIQVYKRLDRIWKDDRVQVHHLRYAQGERWSQKNTVLIDDSMLKALAQPFNHIEVPEFDLKNGNFSDGDGTEVLGQVVAYLEELRAWEDVSSFMRQERFVLNGGYRWDWATGRRVCPDSREDL
ncbi:hypothetical protein MMC26_005857 [Xylographa opegraphella]|nr:hypothetical protein [Xylographa opegraphella]